MAYWYNVTIDDDGDGVVVVVESERVPRRLMAVVVADGVTCHHMDTIPYQVTK